MFDSIIDILEETAQECAKETIIGAMVIAGIWGIVQLNQDNES